MTKWMTEEFLHSALVIHVICDLYILYFLHKLNTKLYM